MTTTTTTTTITTTDNDQVRSWLQGQIKGCLKTYGVQEPLYLVIHRAIEETEQLADSDREQVREALDRLRETDWKLSMGEWSEARRAMAEAHNDLQAAGVAINRGTWRLELSLELDELIESIEYAMIEPGSPRWNAWRGPEGCSILTLQPYYQEHSLIEVLDAWEYGFPCKVVAGELTAELPDDSEYED